MKLDLITLSVPLFFVGVAGEFACSRIWRRDYYIVGDSLASVGAGVLDQVLITVTRPFLFAPPYFWLYDHVARSHYDLPTPTACLVGLLVADFFYYWGHRFTHEVSLLWAGHVVHHQSEEYNLTTALRQNWFASWFLYLFHLPIAVLGMGPSVAAIVIPVVQLYQFWIHTRFIGKLGPFEWLFNTPSHHRVHHGINPEYVDKNYGAILIVWDRLFGTYAEEEATVVYGVLKPLQSWNPVWAYLAPWRDLVHSGSVKAWFMRPGWNPETGALPDVNALFREASATRYRPRLSVAIQAVAFLIFMGILSSASVYLFLAPQLAAGMVYGIAFVLVASLGLFGAWMTRRAQGTTGAGEIVSKSYLA